MIDGRALTVLNSYKLAFAFNNSCTANRLGNAVNTGFWAGVFSRNRRRTEEPLMWLNASAGLIRCQRAGGSVHGPETATMPSMVTKSVYLMVPFNWCHCNAATL